MAGGGNFNRLDTDYFQDAIREMKKGSETLDRVKGEMDKKTKLLKACWEGKGGEQFRECYRVLRQNLNDKYEVLEDLIADLEMAYEDYAAWDAEQAAQLKTMASDSASPDVKSSK